MKALFILLLLVGDYGSYYGPEYISNYDGDTIKFNLSQFHNIIGKNINVRVAGVDTPEIRGKCQKEKDLAKIAKRFVASKLKDAAEIELLNMQRGKYFRIVADVMVNGKNLADILIEEGLAVKYDGGTKTFDWCKW